MPPIGGKKILVKHAGTDATKKFDSFHSEAVLQKIAPQFLIGQIGGAEEESKADDEPEDQNPLIVGEAYGDMVPFGDPMWYQDWYSPYYNDSHRAVRKAVREFVDKEITPFCHEWDEAKKLPREIFIKAAKAGILGAVVHNVSPDLYPYPLPGGVKVEDFDAFHHLIVMDELSRCGSGGGMHLFSPLTCESKFFLVSSNLGFVRWSRYRLTSRVSKSHVFVSVTLF